MSIKIKCLAVGGHTKQVYKKLREALLFGANRLANNSLLPNSFRDDTSYQTLLLRSLTFVSELWLWRVHFMERL